MAGWLGPAKEGTILPVPVLGDGEGISGTLAGGEGVWDFSQPSKYFLGDAGVLKCSLTTALQMAGQTENVFLGAFISKYAAERLSSHSQEVAQPWPGNVLPQPYLGP